MDLNGLIIDNAAVLAPMAGFCDIAMREIADRYGAGFTVSEMVSARALCYGDEKSHKLMENAPRRGKYGIQLFGFDPADFAKATKIVLEYKPDFIDINMGCPAPKITGNGSGSRLLKDTDRAEMIARAVVENAEGTPVSVKMRKGWDKDTITCVDLARKVERAGVNFITVHARTRQEMYNPGIDMDIIKTVKNYVSIPVIGNGDVKSAADVKKMMEYTGCDAVMIGREALCRPWIFTQAKRLTEGRIVPDDIDIEQRVNLMLLHIRKLCEVNGEYAGMKKSRSQVVLYLRGMKGAAHMRGMSNSLSVYADAEALAAEILKENSDV